ncbi:RNA-directed DNA polymerase, eukaryota, reverse transcriptase zinc-binding domain protein [Tanacetum coccineum]
MSQHTSNIIRDLFSIRVESEVSFPNQQDRGAAAIMVFFKFYYLFVVLVICAKVTNPHNRSEDEVFAIDDVESLFVKKLDSQCAENLVRVFVDSEIIEAMFIINDDKAVGPDDFTSKFFKTAWSIVVGDVCSAVKEFFSSGKILGEFNANLISLVPKLQTSLKVTNYRPIACCNVVYKCISKVITNRLKEGLTEIIDSNQSAFILGSQISDNILLSQEFMRGYGWKCGVERCAFKIDIQKVYDTVNWNFLRTTLQNFGFHSSMI